MPEKLLSEKYALEFSQTDRYERQEKLAYFKEMTEVMSPAELASTTVDFIRANNRTQMRGDTDPESKQAIAEALAICRDTSLEQCVAARKINDHTAGNDYETIFEAARFEYELMTDCNFHPVTVPISCDKIYELALK